MIKHKIYSVVSTGLLIGATMLLPVSPLALADTTPVQIHTMAYLDGSEATWDTTGNYGFAVGQTVTATNINSGAEYSDSYTLGSNAPHVYQANSATYDAPVSSYSTFEMTGGDSANSRVLASDAACEAGKFRLLGYKTSPVSFAEAAQATLSTTAPSFTNFSADQYVIIYNETCSTAGGSIGGNVSGGVVDHGTLAVSSVTTVSGSATADGTFANGLKYTFHITIPDNETHLSMKFADWTSGSNTLAAAQNMRISSMQADNSGEKVVITGANTYSAPSLNMSGDLDAGMPGKQVEVSVEVAVPSTTVDGSYSTNYMIQTLP